MMRYEEVVLAPSLPGEPGEPARESKVALWQRKLVRFKLLGRTEGPPVVSLVEGFSPATLGSLGAGDAHTWPCHPSPPYMVHHALVISSCFLPPPDHGFSKIRTWVLDPRDLAYCR